MIWPFRKPGTKTVPFIIGTSVMGTDVYQEVYGVNGSMVAGNVFKDLNRLDGLWSPYRLGNVIDAIGKSSGIEPVLADSDTINILKSAIELGKLSQGAYDVTIDPLIKLWRQGKKEKKPPSLAEIKKKRDLVNIVDLHIVSQTHIYLSLSGQGIDLGGIGKGYAADNARKIYQTNGVRHALLNIGGNVLLMGTKPDGSPWKIGIKNPHNPGGKLLGYIEAVDCSVVTSGGYERFFEYNDPDLGLRRFHHILDPRTGWPTKTDVSGVTIMSPSSTQADALSTAAFILGLEKGMALCNHFSDTHGLFIDQEGKIHMTDGMVKHFRLLN